MTCIRSFTKKCLVSACLVGLCTRYDDRSKASSRCMEMLAGMHWVPVCPEQLGGLATPRMAAVLVGGDGEDVLAGKARVVTRAGIDVTDHFVKGAYQCLEVARMQRIRLAYLKGESPSCGLSPQLGVTAGLLQQHGLKIKEF